MQRFDLKYFNPQHHLDPPCKFRQFDEIASRTVCGVQKAGQPDALCAPKLSAVAKPGLRGVRKAREPGSGPYRIPALRFASHDAWKHPRRLPITLEIRLWETVTVENTSPISPAPSTPRPHHWCIACGDTIIPRRTGNPPKHCSIECLEWDLEDARKHRDRERASKLYTLRAWWRRRLGVRV